MGHLSACVLACLVQAITVEHASPSAEAPAAAVERPAVSETSTGTTTEPRGKAGSPQAVDTFNFDLLLDSTTGQPTATALSSPAIEKAVAKRRLMLKTHQILGLSTLGIMAATVILGQLNYTDLYGRHGGRTGKYLVPKMVGAYATTGAFIATASFSLLAPTPYKKVNQGIDTAVLHKIAVGTTTAGMVTQVVLGFITARSADAGNPDHLARWAKVHQIVGYTTFGAMATAATVWVF